MLFVVGVADFETDVVQPRASSAPRVRSVLADLDEEQFVVRPPGRERQCWRPKCGVTGDRRESKDVSVERLRPIGICDRHRNLADLIEVKKHHGLPRLSKNGPTWR